MNSYGYDNALRKRLAQLRVQKGVSAREMSLALGQNTGYISNIESGKTLPSMTGFFYICEYLDISPCDFFDFDTQAPKEAMRNIVAHSYGTVDPEITWEIITDEIPQLKAYCEQIIAAE